MDDEINPQRSVIFNELFILFKEDYKKLLEKEKSLGIDYDIQSNVVSEKHYGKS